MVKFAFEFIKKDGKQGREVIEAGSYREAHAKLTKMHRIKAVTRSHTVK